MSILNEIDELLVKDITLEDSRKEDAFFKIAKRAGNIGAIQGDVYRGLMNGLRGNAIETFKNEATSTGGMLDAFKTALGITDFTVNGMSNELVEDIAKFVNGDIGVLRDLGKLTADENPDVANAYLLLGRLGDIDKTNSETGESESINIDIAKDLAAGHEETRQNDISRKAYDIVKLLNQLKFNSSSSLDKDAVNTINTFLEQFYFDILENTSLTKSVFNTFITNNFSNFVKTLSSILAGKHDNEITRVIVNNKHLIKALKEFQTLAGQEDAHDLVHVPQYHESNKSDLALYSKLANAVEYLNKEANVEHLNDENKGKVGKFLRAFEIYQKKYADRPDSLQLRDLKIAFDALDVNIVLQNDTKLTVRQSLNNNNEFVNMDEVSEVDGLLDGLDNIPDSYKAVGEAAGISGEELEYTYKSEWPLEYSARSLGDVSISLSEFQFDTDKAIEVLNNILNKEGKDRKKFIKIVAKKRFKNLGLKIDISKLNNDDACNKEIENLEKTLSKINEYDKELKEFNDFIHSPDSASDVTDFRNRKNAFVVKSNAFVRNESILPHLAMQKTLSDNHKALVRNLDVLPADFMDRQKKYEGLRSKLVLFCKKNTSVIGSSDKTEIVLAMQDLNKNIKRLEAKPISPGALKHMLTKYRKVLSILENSHDDNVNKPGDADASVSSTPSTESDAEELTLSEADKKAKALTEKLIQFKNNVSDDGFLSFSDDAELNDEMKGELDEIKSLATSFNNAFNSRIQTKINDDGPNPSLDSLSIFVDIYYRPLIEEVNAFKDELKAATNLDNLAPEQKTILELRKKEDGDIDTSTPIAVLALQKAGYGVRFGDEGRLLNDVEEDRYDNELITAVENVSFNIDVRPIDMEKFIRDLNTKINEYNESNPKNSKNKKYKTIIKPLTITKDPTIKDILEIRKRLSQLDKRKDKKTSEGKYSAERIALVNALIAFPDPSVQNLVTNIETLKAEIKRLDNSSLPAKLQEIQSLNLPNNTKQRSNLTIKEYNTIVKKYNEAKKILNEIHTHTESGKTLSPASNPSEVRTDIKKALMTIVDPSLARKSERKMKKAIEDSIHQDDAFVEKVDLNAMLENMDSAEAVISSTRRSIAKRIIGFFYKSDSDKRENENLKKVSTLHSHLSAQGLVMNLDEFKDPDKVASVVATTTKEVDDAEWARAVKVFDAMASDGSKSKHGVAIKNALILKTFKGDMFESYTDEHAKYATSKAYVENLINTATV